MAEAADLERLREWIRTFAVDRGWDRLRTLKDLSLAIGIESAELQEHFLWIQSAEEPRVFRERRAEIEEELVDVFIYCLAFADRTGIDLLAAAAAKMEANERRFPKQ